MARLLKELKSLAPWQWDSGKKDTVGPATLRDFEKIEELSVKGINRPRRHGCDVSYQDQYEDYEEPSWDLPAPDGFQIKLSTVSKNKRKLQENVMYNHQSETPMPNSKLARFSIATPLSVATPSQNFHPRLQPRSGTGLHHSLRFASSTPGTPVIFTNSQQSDLNVGTSSIQEAISGQTQMQGPSSGSMAPSYSGRLALSSGVYPAPLSDTPKRVHAQVLHRDSGHRTWGTPYSSALSVQQPDTPSTLAVPSMVRISNKKLDSQASGSMGVDRSPAKSVVDTDVPYEMEGNLYLERSPVQSPVERESFRQVPLKSPRVLQPLQPGVCLKLTPNNASLQTRATEKLALPDNMAAASREHAQTSPLRGCSPASARKSLVMRIATTPGRVGCCLLPEHGPQEENHDFEVPSGSRSRSRSRSPVKTSSLSSTQSLDADTSADEVQSRQSPLPTVIAGPSRDEVEDASRRVQSPGKLIDEEEGHLAAARSDPAGTSAQPQVASLPVLDILSKETATKASLTPKSAASVDLPAGPPGSTPLASFGSYLSIESPLAGSEPGCKNTALPEASRHSDFRAVTGIVSPVRAAAMLLEQVQQPSAARDTSFASPALLLEQAKKPSAACERGFIQASAFHNQAMELSTACETGVAQAVPLLEQPKMPSVAREPGTAEGEAGSVPVQDQLLVIHAAQLHDLQQQQQTPKAGRFNFNVFSAADSSSNGLRQEMHDASSTRQAAATCALQIPPLTIPAKPAVDSEWCRILSPHILALFNLMLSARNAFRKAVGALPPSSHSALSGSNPNTQLPSAPLPLASHSAPTGPNPNFSFTSFPQSYPEGTNPMVPVAVGAPPLSQGTAALGVPTYAPMGFYPQLSDFRPLDYNPCSAWVGQVQPAASGAFWKLPGAPTLPSMAGPAAPSMQLPMVAGMQPFSWQQQYIPHAAVLTALLSQILRASQAPQGSTSATSNIPFYGNHILQGSSLLLPSLEFSSRLSYAQGSMEMGSTSANSESPQCPASISGMLDLGPVEIGLINEEPRSEKRSQVHVIPTKMECPPPEPVENSLLTQGVLLEAS